MWVLQVLSLIAFIAIVMNLEKIFYFFNDLVVHGIAAARRKLGMDKTKED
jgi:hypothetical protein